MTNTDANTANNPFIEAFQHIPEKKTFSTRDEAIPFDKIKVEHYIPALDYGIGKARERIAASKMNSTPANVENTILAVGDGLFNRERSHEFSIPSVGIPSPNPSLAPSPRPSMAPSPRPSMLISFYGVDFFMDSCQKTFSSCQTSTECCNGSCINNICRTSDTPARRTSIDQRGGGMRGDAGAATRPSG